MTAVVVPQVEHVTKSTSRLPSFGLITETRRRDSNLSDLENRRMSTDVFPAGTVDPATILCTFQFDGPFAALLRMPIAAFFDIDREDSPSIRSSWRGGVAKAPC